MLSEEDRATATDNMHKEFEVGPCGFQVMQADKQTNKHTDIFITILHILPRHEVRKQKE